MLLGHYALRIDPNLRPTKMNDYTEGRIRQSKISPSTQRTDYSLMAVKTDGNIESRTGHKEYSWAIMVVTLKVVTKRYLSMQQRYSSLRAMKMDRNP